MKTLKIFFGIIFLLPLGLGLNAQTKTKLKLKKTVRGEAQLLRPIQNLAFKKAFSGVFNAGGSMNWGWNKKDNVGAFYSISQYQIFPQPFVGTIDDPHSVQTTHTLGAKFCYDKFTQNGKGMWSPFIAPGWSFINYSRVKSINHPPQELHVNAASINLGLNYYIMFDEWMGVGFTVGYGAVNHVFHPYNICLDEWSSIYNFSDSDSKGALQNIFFGFSFYFDFAYKPEMSED